MTHTVDDLDRAILVCLREDARMPCAEIARRVDGVSARTIRNRLKRLLDKGIIAISVGAMPESLGLTIRADIMIVVEPARVMQVAERLRTLDQVNYLALSTGDFDISATIVARDVDSLQTILTESVHSIPGVQRTRVNVLTKVLKQSYDWPLPKELG
jgi:Lrp/AsnC family transcriptional regulator for asnA, asnC and gidA